jgi:general secretion pathway protein K
VRQRLFQSRNDQGSATVTALIVVGVAAILLAGLMWRQQIQIRTLENIRDRIQVEWLERAAVDFARLVLVQDQRNSQFDHLGEAWALPLADGKVADFLKNTDIPDEIATVTLQGRITDAQGQFNLTNLWDKRFTNVNAPAVAIYARLLDALGLDKGLAQQTAQRVLQSDMPLNHLDDLLQYSFYSPSLVEQIRPYVVILPNATPINLNTAPAEVLMATIPGLSRGLASSLVQQRSTSPLKSLDEVNALLNQLGGGQGATIEASLADVRSKYWIARSEIRLGRGIFTSTALIERSRTPLPDSNFTQVIWNRTGKMLVE